MIKAGLKGDAYTPSFIEHKLVNAKEITRFSIYDTYEDIDGSTKRLYYRVTSWENLPFQEGDRVRLVYINDMSVKPAKDKAGIVQMTHFLSCKCEIVR